MCKDCLEATFNKQSNHHCECNSNESNCSENCCSETKTCKCESLPEEEDESHTSNFNQTSCSKSNEHNNNINSDENKSSSCCSVDEDLVKTWPSIFKDDKWDIILSLTIGLPLIINFISMLIGIHLFHENKYLFFVLATILVFITLPKKLYGAYNEIKNKSFSHIILQVFAIVTVYIYSSIVVLFNIDMRFDFDCLPFVLIIFAISEIIEDKVIEHINENVARETKITQSSQVTILVNGVEKLIWPNQLKKGDEFFVKNGQQIPLDCQLISESAVFDISAITGEVKPYTPTTGDSVISGSINKGNVICLRVVEIESKSLLATLENELKNLQAKATPTYKLGQKFLQAILITIVIVSFVNFGVQWYVFGFEKAILTSIAIILITCPCGIAAGLPLLFSIYMSELLKNKILVRDLIFIEKIKKINAFAFDKTGTITSSIASVYEIGGNTQYLPVLKTIEQYSTHPIATSIVNYLNENNVEPVQVNDINEVSGLGISGSFNNEHIYVGSAKLMNSLNIEIKTLVEDQNLAKQGFIIIYLASENEIKLRVMLNSKLLPGAKQLIEILNKKASTYLITGDNSEVGNYIAQSAKLKKAFCNVSPLNKLEIIKQIQTQENVLYVGDGINDSLSLQQADLSISFSNGSDVAKQSAKAILLAEDLSLIAKLVKFSTQTATNMYQAMWITYIYNIITMTIAILGLVSLEFAPFAEVISVLIIVVNVYRLKLKANKTFKNK